MTVAALPDPAVADPAVLRNFQGLIAAINAVSQYVYSDTGSPAAVTATRGAIAPVDPRGNATVAIYFRQDPAPGAAIYLYNGTNWTAVV